MTKNITLKRILLLLLVFSLIFCCACGKDDESSQKEDQTKQEESKKEDQAEQEDSTKDNEPTEQESSDIIKKITGSADETGIYSIVITLSDKAADKGVVELVYNGAKGTAQENSIVCRYRIEYEKDSSGKYEIKTFYNGDVDRNLHQKSEVKVDIGFGASVRAEDVAITYTPDGGSSQEIYKATADQFR